MKLHFILAGTALAVASQFAVAQAKLTGAPPEKVVPAEAAPADPKHPAYTDQSRLNQTNDPYVKKRIADKEAKGDYKAEKKAAKEEYKSDKKAAKQEYKAEKKDARETRKEELKEMRQVPPAGSPAAPR